MLRNGVQKLLGGKRKDYFQTRNTRAHATVKFNIVNFYKRDSLYSQGLQPNVWSLKKNRPHYVGWFRGGTNVKYSPSRISRPGPNGEEKRRYYCLSFEYTFEHSENRIASAQGVIVGGQLDSQDASHMIIGTGAKGVRAFTGIRGRRMLAATLGIRAEKLPED